MAPLLVSSINYIRRMYSMSFIKVLMQARQDLFKMLVGMIRWMKGLARNSLPVLKIEIVLWKRSHKRVVQKKLDFKMLEVLVSEQPTSTTRELSGYFNVIHTTALRQLEHIQSMEKESLTSCLKRINNIRVACSQSLLSRHSGILFG